MVSYTNACIYKIVCKDSSISDCYVGSTTHFRNRLTHHKRDCNNENSKNYHFYLYQFIRENQGFDNWEMVWIENFECSNKLELHKREREVFDLLKPTLNTIRPYRTLEEAKQEKAINNYNRYRRDKPRIKSHQKKYYERNKEAIKQKNREKYKIYYANNKVTILAKAKTAYNKRKEQEQEQEAELIPVDLAA